MAETVLGLAALYAIMSGTQDGKMPGVPISGS